jgi:hypothetical protein
MMTNFGMFTINLSKIGQDKTTHKKVMTLSNLASLLGHPLDYKEKVGNSNLPIVIVMIDIILKIIFSINPSYCHDCHE